MTITPDQAAHLYNLGRKMRDAQKAYFSTRTQYNLRVSKDYERQFDRLLNECAEEAREKQGSLL